MFQLCEEPVFSPQVASLTAKLERTLVQRGLREPYACLHWRLGDMWLKTERANQSRASHYRLASVDGAAEFVQVALQRHHSITSLLVLVVAENQSMVMVERLRAALADNVQVVTAAGAYLEAPEDYTMRVRNFEATFAEKDICSRANVFFGDQRSTFSAHVSVLGLARARRSGATFEQHLARSGPCYPHPTLHDADGVWCY